MKKIKVALGLSGGVDSAVSAYLLKQQGFDVSCFHLICFDPPAGGPGCRGDQDRKDALAVALHLGLPFQVLDFRKEYQKAVIDYFKKEYVAGRTPNPDVVCNREIKFGLFWEWALENSFDYVATGHYAKLVWVSRKSRTNTKNAKKSSRRSRNFVMFANTQADVRDQHEENNSSVFLTQPADKHKDQTYFLWAVPREKFEHVLFPLGDLLKSEVRAMAKKIKLPVAEKKDSTGICFIGEVRVEDFLKRLGVKEKEGEVVLRKARSAWHEADSEKREARSASQEPSAIRHSPYATSYEPRASNDDFVVIGSHRGVAFYTIGQRHGFEISGKWKDESGKLGNGKFSTFNFQFSSSSARPPLYVIAKDVRRNRLVVGFGAEAYRSQFVVSDTNWLAGSTRHAAGSGKREARSANQEPTATRHPLSATSFEPVFVRIRHLGDLIPCEINASTHQRINVLLRFAQRGIAAGQSAVFYNQAGIVLGGGVINFVDKLD